MNKTVTASVGGFVFNIEEQAYEALKTYLENIRYSLNSGEEAEEVMQDIEFRIAEIFRETLANERREVINKADIEAVIAVMGEPEAYGGENTESARSATGEKEQRSTHSEKQIFRDPDQKMVGGVCAGISAYFGWDPLVLRILFVALFFGLGTGLLLYIVLWIIIPEAKTTADKLRMRGEKVDVENIRQRFNDFKKDIHEFTGPERKKKVKEFSRNLGGQVEKGLSGFFDVVGRALGLVFIVLAIALIVYLLRGAFSTDWLVSISDKGLLYLDPQTFGEAFFGSAERARLVGLALLGVLIPPAVGLLIAGIRLIFRTRFHIRALNVVLAILSLASFAVLLVIGLQTGADFSRQNEVELNAPLTQPAGDTLFLDVQTDTWFSDHIRDPHDCYFELIHLDDKKIVYGFPTLTVKKTTGETFEIEIIRSAYGTSQKKAADRAGNIEYHFTQTDSLLQFAPVFSVPKSDRIRGQELQVVVKVPEGKTVYLSPKMSRIIFDIPNQHDLKDKDMTGKYWIMESGGLRESRR